jgi:hypothetical protein
MPIIINEDKAIKAALAGLKFLIVQMLNAL